VRFSLLGSAALGAALLGAVLSAAPAAAITHPPLPIADPGLGLWAGYTATGAFHSISVAWTEPTVTCKAHNYVDMEVVISLDDPANQADNESVGAGDTCSSDRFNDIYHWPTEFSLVGTRSQWATNVAAENPLVPGDALTESITRDGTNYVMAINDTTQGWSMNRTVPMPAGDAPEARIMMANDTAYTEPYTPYVLTHIQINGAPVSPANLVAHNAPDFSDPYTSTVGPISNDSFTITRTLK
jgi:hypothetical protein